MTDPSASPRSYPVGEVKGRCPAGLEDFVGVASFTVISGDLAERVFGVGERTATAVRFRQQDLGGNGREVRTWLIDVTPTGFVAVVEPNPAR